MHWFGIAALVVLVWGCSSGEIYFYANEADESQLVNLKQGLSSTGLRVTTTSVSLPFNMKSTTLICHSYVNNQKALNKIQTILRENGIQVSEVYFGANPYNHIYTENNFGVYVVGDKRGSELEVEEGSEVAPTR